jgi:hypothetical protein
MVLVPEELFKLRIVPEASKKSVLFLNPSSIRVHECQAATKEDGMSIKVARKSDQPFRFNIAAAVIGCFLAITGSAAGAQQPIAPVDFRPFVDGRNWIVRQPLAYTIGVSKDSITIPSGFVTDFASIPQVFHSLLRQNGSYLLPAVVHDYLYWKQTCTRDQSDQILWLGMIENEVPSHQRVAIYMAVRAAGGFAWDANARDRAARLVRIIPPDRLSIGPNKLWPNYQRELSQAGVLDAANTPITTSFCSRANMQTDEALTTK